MFHFTDIYWLPKGREKLQCMDYTVDGVTGFIFTLTFTRCRWWISYLDKHSPALKVQSEKTYDAAFLCTERQPFPSILHKG